MPPGFGIHHIGNLLLIRLILQELQMAGRENEHSQSPVLPLRALVFIKVIGKEEAE